jgi:hypothetical protein
VSYLIIRLEGRKSAKNSVFLSVIGEVEAIIKLGDFGHSVEITGTNPAYKTQRNGDYIAPV